MNYVMLKDVCTINMGQSPDSNSYNDNGEGVPFFQGNADFGERYPITRKWCSAPTKMASPEDILISVRAPIGAMNYAKEDCCIGRGLAAITPDKARVSSEFIFWLLKGKNAELNSKGTGSTFKAIGRKILEETLIPDISLEKQSGYSNILEKIYEIIQARKLELQKLDDLIKARFVEMFGDPKLNDKGWKSGIVSDYYEIKGGKRIPKGMGYAEGVTKHPYLRATDMKNETILDDNIHYIDDEVYEHIKRYTVKGGDIYLTNVGVNLGLAGVIPEKYDGANLTENAVKLVPKTEKVIDGVFLAHYINSPGIQDYINERKMSVGVPKLAIFRIETMPVLLPPMEMQKQFVLMKQQVDKSKVAVQKALEQTQLLFDSLMQKYFG
ncbi:restriction endonuclease subunit S [Mediterraneibacter agrestimuris]|uniref:restriction endonuclease subunit S n=1 Tax=Mediterraneibacter agrestimuris TaxID=2941333 RepID=UPI00203FD612|nr:restriction endonuclease subunit S [Mediterraneibacter agrestimuris]